MYGMCVFVCVGERMCFILYASSTEPTFRPLAFRGATSFITQWPTAMWHITSCGAKQTRNGAAPAPASAGGKKHALGAETTLRDLVAMLLVVLVSCRDTLIWIYFISSNTMIFAKFPPKTNMKSEHFCIPSRGVRDVYSTPHTVRPQIGMGSRWVWLINYLSAIRLLCVPRVVVSRRRHLPLG